MTKPLIIIGTGGSAHDVLDIVEARNAIKPEWAVQGFLDDSRPPGTPCHGFHILGSLSEACRFHDAFFLNCIGSDRNFRNRPDILSRTELPIERFATLVHPAASVSSRATLGRGSYVNFGVSIGGGVRVGNQISIGPGAIIGHDTIIEDFTLLAPASVVSGYVRIERCCYIGARSVIRQQLTVGAESLVGMGAVVTRDVVSGTTVIGNPARPMVRAPHLAKERISSK